MGIFLIFGICIFPARAGNGIKVFGTDSYHFSRVFEQKFGSFRTKNKHDLYEAVGAKSIEYFDQKPQLGWKRIYGKMGWTLQSKINGQWVVSFVSYSVVENPIDAIDWLYLPNGEHTNEMDKVYADHIKIVEGNVKKSDAIVPGMLNNFQIENNMLMLRGGHIRGPPTSE